MRFSWIFLTSYQTAYLVNSQFVLGNNFVSAFSSYVNDNLMGKKETCEAL